MKDVVTLLWVRECGDGPVISVRRRGGGGGGRGGK